MSKKTKARAGGRERFWRGAIRKRERSGLTIRAFCEREGLTESAYHFWRRRLLISDGVVDRTSSPRRRTVKADVEARSVPTFASLTLGQASSEAAGVSSVASPMPIEIVLRDNVRVRVAGGVNLTLLHQVLHQVLDLMERRGC